jgi:hypothetical protein
MKFTSRSEATVCLVLLMHIQWGSNEVDAPRGCHPAKINRRSRSVQGRDDTVTALKSASDIASLTTMSPGLEAMTLATTLES